MSCKRGKKTGKEFFIHHNVIGLKFRGKFIAFLKRAYRKGELSFHGELSSLKDVDNFEQRLDKAVKNKWVAYAERPFSDDPEQVLKYLARYTHRVAIANSRLTAMRDGYVHFRWKDYRDGGMWKPMALEATEFIRRFLLHVLPSGFMRIRQYGFLANCYRKKKLALCRELLGVSVNKEAEDHLDDAQQSEHENQQREPDRCVRCPKCETGRMKIVEEISAATQHDPIEKNITLPPRGPPIAVAREIP